MGGCFCKEGSGGEVDVYIPSRSTEWRSGITSNEPQSRVREVESVTVDQLVLEMLGLIATFVDK